MSSLGKRILNSRIFNIVKWLWLLVVIVGGVYYSVNHYQAAIGYLKNIRISGLLLSIVFIIISRLLNIVLIRDSVLEVGWKPASREFFSLVSLTQLGKYVPGGVWQFVARFGSYRSNNLSMKDMGKAFFLENVWVVLGGTMSGLFFLLLGDADTLLGKIGLQVPAALRLIVIILSILLWLAGIFIFQRLMHRNDALKQSLKRSMWLFTGHFVMYFTMGLSFYFLFSSLGADHLLFAIGGFILSYLAGYVALFAPGGIGVREVVLIAVFSGIAVQEELAAITIVHRLLYTVIEFLLGLIGFILQPKQPGTPQLPEVVNETASLNQTDNSKPG